MKSLPTVLHSFPVWLPQTQTWMYNQVAELQRMGVVAHVACERTENLDQFGVANLHCLADEPAWRQICDKGMRKLRIRRNLDHLVRVGKKTAAQIVHSHFGNVGWADLGAVCKLGTRHVVTFYGLDVNMLPRQYPFWLERYAELFATADLILCEGSHMASCIVDLGCPAHKLAVQHLGVDVERLDFQPRQWHPGETLRVLVAASFREKKGIPLAIEALGMIRRDLPVELTLIGDAGQDEDSQREKDKILAALQHSGLQPHARLLGYQTHTQMLHEAYRHHIFLHPSMTAQNGDTEGGAPVCITEMLATGMPVVSTTHCDIPEVVGPALHPLLAPERNVQALVACLQTAIHNPTRWAEWGTAGRHRVEKEYHIDTQARRLLAHYEALVEI